jgi:hypothetical protein
LFLESNLHTPLWRGWKKRQLCYSSIFSTQPHVWFDLVLTFFLFCLLHRTLNLMNSRLKSLNFVPDSNQHKLRFFFS